MQCAPRNQIRKRAVLVQPVLSVFVIAIDSGRGRRLQITGGVGEGSWGKVTAYLGRVDWEVSAHPSLTHARRAHCLSAPSALVLTSWG
eukprot:1046471-Rhodomonas_salina.2